MTQAKGQLPVSGCSKNWLEFSVHILEPQSVGFEMPAFEAHENPKSRLNECEFWDRQLYISHIIHVWYICLHLHKINQM